MFKFVHHVRILVHNADDMVKYMEENFVMSPVKVQVYEKRGMKNAIYRVGQTNLEFTEPLDPDSKMGRFLDREGPGVYHIAFGVDDIVRAARELAAKGNKMPGSGGPSQSAEGYLTANIDPKSALGFPFQIAQG
jgi:methylmalonyl-CoA/ethylmalonyl-CoA epimerase